MKPRVLISCPNQGWIHKHAVFALMRMQADGSVLSKTILPTHKPYVNSLHKVVNELLRDDFEFLVSFDDDNPPRNNPLDLVHLNLDIIGCPTPVWHNAVPGDYPIYWNAMLERNDGWTPNPIGEGGLQEVDAVGTGCIVVKREVFEALRDAPPAERWFAREWNEEGEVERGGDYMFCKRAKAAGFQVWAHYDYPCFHFNEIELDEVQQAFGSVKDAS